MNFQQNMKKKTAKTIKFIFSDGCVCMSVEMVKNIQKKRGQKIKTNKTD